MTKRFERRQRSGIRLTERDLRTVEAVFEARYMTNQLIARLFYKPTTFSSCKQRVRYLFDLGYLKKRKAQVNQPDVYYLGLEGKRHIVSLGQYTREEVNRIAGVGGEGAVAPTLMLKHELTLSRLYVNARLECRGYGWDMHWKNTRLLEMERLGIEPDASTEVVNGQRSKQAFIEFTAAMPSAKELSQKVAGYEGYWERTENPTAVLWLTTSRNKINRLRETVSRSVYKDYYLLALIEDAARFLTGRIWWWSEAEEMIQWLGGP